MRNSQRPMRAKLMFSATSGQPEESPPQLVEIVNALQAQHFLPEAFIVDPECPLERVVRDAVKAGIRLIVLAGGDGTIGSLAGAMVGRPATLGVTPIQAAIPRGYPYGHTCCAIARLPAPFTTAVALRSNSGR